MRSEFYHSTIEVNDYPGDKLYIKNAEQLDEFIKKFNKTTYSIKHFDGLF